MKYILSGIKSAKAVRIAAIAALGLGVSGCNYDGGVGIGYASNGYYSGYDCDPYSPFDNYYDCDYRYGFSNIGYGGGWYGGYYYPGYGSYLFDNYGRRFAMQNDHRRYWGQRRYEYNRVNRGGPRRDNQAYQRGQREDARRENRGYQGGQRQDRQQGYRQENQSGRSYNPGVQSGQYNIRRDRPEGAGRGGNGGDGQGAQRQRTLPENRVQAAPDTSTQQYRPRREYRNANPSAQAPAAAPEQQQVRERSMQRSAEAAPAARAEQRGQSWGGDRRREGLGQRRNQPQE